MNAISRTALADVFVAGNTIPQADGTVTVIADGTTQAVFSCSVTGLLGTAPAGTVNDETQARISGNFIVFSPSGHPYAFLWLPNAL